MRTRPRQVLVHRGARSFHVARELPGRCDDACRPHHANCDRWRVPRSRTLFVEQARHQVDKRAVMKLPEANATTMEVDVVDEKALRLVERIQQIVDLLLQRGHLVGRCALGRQAGCFDFEDSSRFMHLAVRDRWSAARKLNGSLASVGGPDGMKVPEPCRACTTPMAAGPAVRHMRSAGSRCGPRDCARRSLSPGLVAAPLDQRAHMRRRHARCRPSPGGRLRRGGEARHGTSDYREGERLARATKYMIYPHVRVDAFAPPEDDSPGGLMQSPTPHGPLVYRTVAAAAIAARRWPAPLPHKSPRNHPRQRQRRVRRHRARRDDHRHQRRHPVLQDHCHG